MALSLTLLRIAPLLNLGVELYEPTEQRRSWHPKSNPLLSIKSGDPGVPCFSGDNRLGNSSSSTRRKRTSSALGRRIPLAASHAAAILFPELLIETS